MKDEELLEWAKEAKTLCEHLVKDYITPTYNFERKIGKLCKQATAEFMAKALTPWYDLIGQLNYYN